MNKRFEYLSKCTLYGPCTHLRTFIRRVFLFLKICILHRLVELHGKNEKIAQGRGRRVPARLQHDPHVLPVSEFVADRPVHAQPRSVHQQRQLQRTGVAGRARVEDFRHVFVRRGRISYRYWTTDVRSGRIIYKSTAFSRPTALKVRRGTHYFLPDNRQPHQITWFDLISVTRREGVVSREGLSLSVDVFSFPVRPH